MSVLSETKRGLKGGFWAGERVGIMVEDLMGRERMEFSGKLTCLGRADLGEEERLGEARKDQSAILLLACSKEAAFNWRTCEKSA